MTAPEVTREEAERIATRDDGYTSPRLARTVVALYDEIEAVRRMERTAIRALVEIQPEFKARGECIDRMRDGWRPWMWQGQLHWMKPDHDGSPESTPEPMTPEQQAVMAR